MIQLEQQVKPTYTVGNLPWILVQCMRLRNKESKRRSQIPQHVPKHMLRHVLQCQEMFMRMLAGIDDLVIYVMRHNYLR